MGRGDGVEQILRGTLGELAPARHKLPSVGARPQAVRQPTPTGMAFVLGKAWPRPRMARVPATSESVLLRR